MYVESFSSLKHSFNIVEECNVDLQNFVYNSGREKLSICNTQPLEELACPGTDSSEMDTSMCNFAKCKVHYVIDYILG